MKTLLFLMITFCLFSIDGLAQISRGGLPQSIGISELEDKIATIDMPDFDVAAMIEEDELFYSGKDEAYRFGKEFAVQYNLENSGQWEELPNGDRIWRLQVHSTNALSLNFLFDEFCLPVGGELFLYNPEQTAVLGAFTHQNNKHHGRFSTTLIKGNTTIIEYFEPAEVAGQGKLQIGTIVHAYKDFYNKNQKSFGDSGDCNNNINCPEAANWQDEKRAVAMIVQGGTRLCTGTMVNNANNDGTPYFFTAYHCVGFNLNITQVENWLFMFNYESPVCTNQDGPTNQTVSGCFYRSSGQISDFLLLELSEQPPAAYDVYMAGWNREDIATSEGVTCIHHPSGDIKKISYDSNGVFSQTQTTAAESHWEVSEWESGTTEGGSSGAALFNDEGKIIGCLSGGDASCSSTNEYDRFGKFSYSWLSNGSTADMRLKNWLDPNGTNALEVEGMDLVAPEYNLDASVGQLIVTEDLETCETNFVPTVKLTNLGNNDITSATISWQVDDQAAQTYNWTGTLSLFGFEEITLSEINLELGEHTVNVELTSVNGTDTDENVSNDVVAENFTITEGENVTVNLTTDQYGYETSFQITNAAGEVVVEELTFGDFTEYNLDYCLVSGCYTFTIFDLYNDGICCTFGEGAFSVENEEGLVFGSGSEFESSESINFCIGALGETFVNLRVLLEGPYDGNGGMNLPSTNWMPLEQPYGQPPFDYFGTESIDSVIPGMLDWVLVEARKGTPNLDNRQVGTEIVEVRAGILLTDGTVMIPGGGAVKFVSLQQGESYHFAVRHRNHIAVLSKEAFVLTSNAISYDFTSGVDQAWGTDQQKLTEDGKAVLFAGDANGDDVIQTTDIDAWDTNLSGVGYHKEDIDLNGNVNNVDYNFIINNLSIIGHSEIQKEQ